MRLAVAIALLLVGPTAASAQEFCNWRPRQIDNPSDIRGTTLVLITSRETLGIYNNCVTLVHKQFGSVLEFALVNRFPKNIGIQSAYAVVRSIRTLSTNPPIKISLSRGKGWLLPDQAGRSSAVQREMFFEPFKGTIEDWNAAHATFLTPEKLAERLKITWHAYLSSDLSLSSADTFEFWQIDPRFDRSHDVSTHYLLRFDVNTGTKVSLIPFTVHLQQQVKQINLKIYSSIESLSAEYIFVVR